MHPFFPFHSTKYLTTFAVVAAVVAPVVAAVVTAAAAAAWLQDVGQRGLRKGQEIPKYQPRTLAAAETTAPPAYPSARRRL